MSHVDPPIPLERTGWGLPEHSDDQRLVVEGTGLEALPNLCAATEARGASGMLPSIEEKILAKFQFDSGWDCMVAERMVYGLEDTQTLMVPQNMGNCVGDSHDCLIASRIGHEVLALGEAEEPLGRGMLGIPFIPYSYGVGRMVGNMLGPGDGSYCSAQIKGTMQYGFLPCFTPGLEEYSGTLPQASTNVGRLFGKSKREIMKWADKAQQFDLEEAPKVQTADEAYDLIANKQIPLQICSGQGFKYDRFDEKYGVHLYKMSGRWSHSMQLPTAFTIKGQQFTVIRNQWGINQHKGSPEIGIPGGCMVITIEDFAKWLRKAQCVGIGAIKGLESNPGA